MSAIARHDVPLGPAAATAQDRILTDVWEDHPDEGYRRDQSHWRGHGRWTETAWQDLVSGLERRVKDLYKTAGRRLENERPVGLDWGCGGGSGVVALAPFFGRVYGVDVSSKNLAETQRQSNALDSAHRRFTPMLATSRPVDVITSLPEPIDVFTSAATFHLFPTKRYASEVLHTAFAAMQPGGLGYIQIRYDDGTPKYAPRQGYDRYEVEHVFASSWQVSEFWTELENAGFSPMKVTNFNTAVNFCSFFFRK